MILDQFRLDNKVALVTGAGRGLGQAMALGLAEAGADIAGLDRSGSADTRAKVEAMGRRYLEFKRDLGVASVADLNEVVAQVERELGALEILVNNAGIIRRAPAIDFTESDWDEVIQVNQRAVFFLAQAAAKVMLPRGRGKIINVVSMLSYQGGVFVPSYTAAKSAIAGVTRALANEWAGSGVNVNGIAPGYMVTDNTAALRANAERSESILARIPARRWGAPEDLQGAVLLLASEAGRYMHGAIIPVDGGWLAR